MQIEENDTGYPKFINKLMHVLLFKSLFKDIKLNNKSLTKKQ